jgi:type IV pilus assembly protein PilY1
MGRAAFALKLSNGTVAGFNFNAGNYADMTHSITDVTGLDSDGDRLVNRIYAPDMKGQMFAFEDDDKDGAWNRRKLFSASADGVQRKTFYAPDIVIYTPTSTTLGDMIYFGTGDRENPTETSVVNRFYAIKNDWQSASADLTEADLYDATANLIQMGDEAQKLAAKEAINNAKGWFFELPNLGEKVISAPIVYGGVVYFTTYSPETGVAAVSDPCAVAGGRGTARLYAVDYLTGAAVMNYSDVTETDGDGNTIGSDGASPYGLLDRCQTIGTSIPSAPVIAILEGGAHIYIGVEGGVRNEDAKNKADMQTYFWREVNTN